MSPFQPFSRLGMETPPVLLSAALVAPARGPVGAGGPLFRFSLTKEDQTAVLAQYVVADLGLRRWAILHPDDSYGSVIASGFRQAVETLGGRIVADISYPPDKSDLQPEAKRL